LILLLILMLFSLIRRPLLLDSSPSFHGWTKICNTVGWKDRASEFDIVIILVGALDESSIGSRCVCALEEDLQISLSIEYDLPCDYPSPFQCHHHHHCRERAVPVSEEPREEVDLDTWD